MGAMDLQHRMKVCILPYSAPQGPMAYSLLGLLAQLAKITLIVQDTYWFWPGSGQARVNT